MNKKVFTVKLCDILLEEQPEKHHVALCLNKAVVDATDELNNKYGHDDIELSKGLNRILRLEIDNKRVVVLLEIEQSVEYNILIAAIDAVKIFVEDMDKIYKIESLIMVDDVMSLVKEIMLHNVKHGNNVALIMNMPEMSKEMEQLSKAAESCKSSCLWTIEKYTPRRNNQSVLGESEFPSMVIKEVRDGLLDYISRREFAMDTVKGKIENNKYKALIAKLSVDNLNMLQNYPVKDMALKYLKDMYNTMAYDPKNEKRFNLLVKSNLIHIVFWPIMVLKRGTHEGELEIYLNWHEELDSVMIDWLISVTEKIVEKIISEVDGIDVEVSPTEVISEDVLLRFLSEDNGSYEQEFDPIDKKLKLKIKGEETGIHVVASIPVDIESAYTKHESIDSKQEASNDYGSPIERIRRKLTEVNYQLENMYSDSGIDINPEMYDENLVDDLLNHTSALLLYTGKLSKRLKIVGDLVLISETIKYLHTLNTLLNNCLDEELLLSKCVDVFDTITVQLKSLTYAMHKVLLNPNARLKAGLVDTLFDPYVNKNKLNKSDLKKVLGYAGPILQEMKYTTLQEWINAGENIE